jgi:hypothetical protein
MTKLPIEVREYRHSLAVLAAAVVLGVTTTVASAAPSIAQVADIQTGVADHTQLENVAYVARRGVVVGRGYRGGYRGAYVGRGGYYRGGYAYRRGYGYGVGPGVAGAAAGAAILGGALAAPYYAAPYPYYAPPNPYGGYYVPDPGY